MLTLPTPLVESRWKDLYRIGGISSVLLAGLIAFAVIAYFIWPYTPGFASTEDIFVYLQTDRLGALFSLDIMMLVTMPIDILLITALFVALKRFNESYALIALVLGLAAAICGLGTTIIGTVWFVLLARAFFRLVKEQQ